MIFIGIGIYIFNTFLFIFSLNVFVKQKRKDYVFLAISYLIVALLGVYFFMEEYLLESIFSLIIFGLPGIFGENILPKFIKKDINILRVLQFIPAISMLLIIFAK